ncbi:interleukin-8-like isoform X2 [Hoplias malabaricus]|uniref:interleukin-8-like isoform X2 n=1 Tax=Hoplias malabaricus TaxID=27720 RepID=UPI003461C2F7
MTLSARLLLAATALCCLSTLLAMPMELFATSHRCRCIDTTEHPVNTSLFKRIEVIPPGPNCRNTEILITLKDSSIVCVAPEAKWINGILIRLLKGKSRSTSSQA